MPRFIDQFEVILLDMMGTFMFSGDRFSEHEDYSITYRKMGGTLLSDRQVNVLISTVFRRMSADYENPTLYECFPAVAHYLAQVLSESHLPAREIKLLDAVFASHEAGVIPEAYVSIIRQLSRTHRLGVVSNFWSQSRPIHEEFERVGVSRMFEAVVFSSDYGINKPSPLLYGKALELMGVDASQAVFVGDSLRYDVAGAKGAGLATVWINGGERETDGGNVDPERIVGHLGEVLSLEAIWASERGL